MSSEILTTLRDRLASEPKPPEHELAQAHVSVIDAGIPNAIDDRVLLANAKQ